MKSLDDSFWTSMSPSPALAPPSPAQDVIMHRFLKNVYEEPLKLGLDKKTELTAANVKLRSEKIS